MFPASPRATAAIALALVLPTLGLGAAAGPSVGAAAIQDALDVIETRHRDDPGLIGIVPVTEPSPHVGLIYEGQAPDGVEARIEAGVPVQPHEHAEVERPIEPVSDDELAQITSGVYAQASSPAPAEAASDPKGIGSGNHLLITVNGDTFRCTANFVFQNQTTGTYYLGTAGHCVLPGGMDDSTDPNFNQPTVRVCEEGGRLATLPLCSNWVTLGDVLYARQENNGNQFGHDYAFVEVPSSAESDLRPRMWFWDGPTALHNGPPAIGEPLGHSGYGQGVGEVAPTRNRAGVGGDDCVFFSPGFCGVGWIRGGDSGSGIVTVDPVGGNQAVGDLTHSIVVVGAPTFIGTTAENAIDFTENTVGVRLSLVTVP